MNFTARNKRAFTGLAALVAFVGVSGLPCLGARSAQAEEVSSTGKGITGGALLGAEVVTMTESIVGVHNGWAYAIGGGVGAIGGGIGGYFIEQSSTDGRVPMYMLAGGMALVIPAIVLTLNGTRYRPAENAVEDHTFNKAPVANPGEVGGSPVVGVPPAGGGAATPAPPMPAQPTQPGTPTTTPPPTQSPPRVPQSLLDVNDHGNFRMGLPVPNVVPMFSLREQKLYGLQQGTELRLPVLKVTF